MKKPVKPKGVVDIEQKVIVERVQPLSLDFGREDLNSLKDKLNEVIACVNNP